MSVLGIACGEKHASATLVGQGRVLAAVTESQMGGREGGMPERAIAYCIEVAGETGDDGDIDCVACVRPRAPRGKMLARRLEIELSAMAHIRRILDSQWEEAVPLCFVDEATAIASGAYLASAYPRTAILRLDADATWAGVGDRGNVHTLRESGFPHTLGALWEALSGYLGFAGEREAVEALATWGEPTFLNAMRRIIAPGDDGWPAMDLSWAAWHRGEGEGVSERFWRRFGPPRQPWEVLDARHAHVAASAQALLEEQVLAMAGWLRRESGADALCLCGTLAGNATLAGRLLQERIFDVLYVPPATGADGAALGAALTLACGEAGGLTAAVEDARLGPDYDDGRLVRCLADAHLRHDAPTDLVDRAVALLNEDKLVGWFQGRAEFGGRPLGGRCMLADPASDEAVLRMLQSAGHPEAIFRPAVCVAEEFLDRYFANPVPSRFAQYRFPVVEVWDTCVEAAMPEDGKVRVISIDARRDPLLHALLHAFGQKSDVPMLACAALQDRGDATPEGALRCFFTTGMDALIMGRWLVVK